MSRGCSEPPEGESHPLPCAQWTPSPHGGRALLGRDHRPMTEWSRAPSFVHSTGDKPRKVAKGRSDQCDVFILRHSDVHLFRCLLRRNQRLLIAEGSTISVLSCVMRCLGVRIRLMEAKSFLRWKPHHLQLPLPHMPAWLCFSISPIPTPRQPTQFSQKECFLFPSILHRLNQCAYILIKSPNYRHMFTWFT